MLLTHVIILFASFIWIRNINIYIVHLWRYASQSFYRLGLNYFSMFLSLFVYSILCTLAPLIFETLTSSIFSSITSEIQNCTTLIYVDLGIVGFWNTTYFELWSCNYKSSDLLFWISEIPVINIAINVVTCEDEYLAESGDAEEDLALL